MYRVCLGLLFGLVTTGAAEQPDAAKKELAAMQGNWAVESLEYNGKDLTDKFKLTFVFKEDVVTVEGDAKVRKEYAKLRLKLHPDINPKGVDVTVTAGVQLEAVMEGIYELKGDRLRLCVKVFGKDRPNEFTSAGGASIALVTLKRQKGS